MPKKLIATAFFGGLIVGASMMAAIGLRSATAQSGIPGLPVGLYQIAVNQGNGTDSAWRLNTASGEVVHCVAGQLGAPSTASGCNRMAMSVSN